MINSLTNKDFISFEDFDLKWRFTEERHNLLPKEELSQIKPLSRIKATYFNNYSRKYLGNASLLKAEFSRIDPLQIVDDHEVARAWLQAKEIDPTTEVLISWDSSSCVLTTWQAESLWGQTCLLTFRR